MGNDVFILFIIISMEESAGILSDEEVTDLGDVRREDDGMVAVRWTSVRIRYRKRSRYYV